MINKNDHVYGRLVDTMHHSLEIADDEELGLKAKLEARDDSRLNLDNNAIACSVEVINVTSQVT